MLAFIGAHILKRAGIPQTLGFMLAGIVLSLTGLLTQEWVQSLRIFVALALGLIGYNIGHELKSEKIKGRTKKLAVIVVFEATAAFALVSVLTYIITAEWHWAVLFGSVASATAPAATADVVWECDCEGPVTSSLMFVLAADDVAAVILTNAAISYALWVYSPTTTDLMSALLTPVLKILGSAAIGIVFGLLFLIPVNREADRGRLLELELGMVLLLIGVVQLFEFSDIFAAMVFGFVVGRYIDEDKEQVPVMLEKIMSPVVMVFFVLVGARMAHLLTTATTLVLILVTAALYLGGRTLAKYVGTRAGATLVGDMPAVRKYLGTCLLCQAGVALGLSFIIEEQFVTLGGRAAEIGGLVLGVVAVSTMVLELIGPLAVKHSLKAANELPDTEETLFLPHEIVLYDLPQEHHNVDRTLDTPDDRAGGLNTRDD